MTRLLVYLAVGIVIGAWGAWIIPRHPLGIPIFLFGDIVLIWLSGRVLRVLQKSTGR